MKKIIMGFIDMWKADYRFKTLATSTLSALVGLGFTVFNVVLGIVYKSVWNISISVYYVLLAIVRGIVVHSQRKVNVADNQKKQEQYKRIYFKTHILMIFMDMCLIAPIVYMVIGERSYEYGLIPAIAMAAYTTYRITIGIINLGKSRKQENIFIKELRTVDLQDSLVAVLTLQNALIIANGSDMQSMLALTAWTSAGIWLMIVIFTVKSFLYVRHR